MILAALALAFGQLFTCEVVSVHDGDSLRCADGTRVRLQGVDANELDGSCHFSCAAQSARWAQANLAELALNKRADCISTGKSYRRVTAWCTVARTDLSCAQVSSGAAVVWARFDPDNRLLPCELNWRRIRDSAKPRGGPR